MTLPSLFVKANEIKKGSIVNVFYGLDGVLVMSQVKDPDTLRINLMSIIDKLNEKIKKRNDGN